MKLTDFLIDLGNSVAYYPKLVEVTGGVLPNLFLCQMYYWLGKQKNPEGWIYKTQAEIEKETGLTRKQQETARKFLKARGLLQEKYTGCPRRLEFWLDKDTLNQRWSAFMNNLELPIAKITSSWTRRAKKSQDDADQKPSIMPNSDNIDSTNSAICNDQIEQYILPQSSSTECPDSTGYNAFLGHTVMPSSDNLSIYTKNTSKITSEITHNAPLASPPAPPTHESVCEKEELDLTTEEIELEEPTPEKPSLEEPTLQQPTSLSKNSESLQQTDNTSRGSTIAGGSFDKSEQSNKLQLTCPYKTARNVKELIDAWLTDPTAMSDDCVPLLVRDSIKWNRWVLPWRNGERKLNNLYQNFNPIVVDFLAQELATKSKRSARQEIDHAIAVMNTWEKTKGGWTNLNQRYQQAHSAEAQRLAQQKAIQTAHAAPNELRAVLPEIRQARRFTKVA
ncbi:hypothetical protein LC613_39235 [Nostoc sphaeroides CHAB 2801]|uniref:hypothetical protein n=1 Tax=Nostoc sphaeroides TaxID=446679 RepID=UPI001E44206D|nr:hypothetical protein [Nostoc sphaeroides]MCC5633500.1 hypothetical protein [Nostoc sphaeroides CHAB 2801]